MQHNFGECRFLTKDEEYAAWEKKDHDLLVRSQIPYVISHAKRLCRARRFPDIEDCIAAGMAGLLKCIRDSFDASKGYRLSTFCRLPIIGHINLWIDNTTRQSRRFWTNELAGDKGVSDDPAANLIGCEDEAEKQKAIARMRIAITKLPTQRRIAIESLLAGEKLHVVGEREGLCRAAVSANRKRGIAQLRELMSAS